MELTKREDYINFLKDKNNKTLASLQEKIEELKTEKEKYCKFSLSDIDVKQKIQNVGVMIGLEKAIKKLQKIFKEMGA
jgi:hypothetical protein